MEYFTYDEQNDIFNIMICIMNKLGNLSVIISNIEWHSLPCAEHSHCFPPVDAAALTMRTLAAPVILVLAVVLRRRCLLASIVLVEMVQIRTDTDIVVTTYSAVQSAVGCIGLYV